MAVDLSGHRYWAGAFQATWDPAGNGTEFNLGYTERGIDFHAEQSTHPVMIDMYGNSRVDELFLGINASVVIESLSWKVDSLHMLRQAMRAAGDVAFGTDVTESVVDFSSLQSNMGLSLRSAAGPLVLTAVTGGMVGATKAMKLTFPYAIPTENIDLLLTGRAPVRVPFRFRILPDLATAGELRFWTVEWTA